MRDEKKVEKKGISSEDREIAQIARREGDVEAEEAVQENEYDMMVEELEKLPVKLKYWEEEQDGEIEKEEIYSEKKEDARNARLKEEDVQEEETHGEGENTEERNIMEEKVKEVDSEAKEGGDTRIRGEERR